MNGFQIFKSALNDIIGNIYEALAISGLLWVGITALQIILIGQNEVDLNAPATQMRLLGLNIVVLFVTIWIAVAWHRFILIGEMPKSVVPPLHGGQMLRYLGVSLIIGVVVLLTFLIVSAIATVVFVGMFGTSARLLATLVTAVPVVFLTYRLSPMLPAVALGKKVSFADAWRATEPLKWDILLAGFVMLSFALVLLSVGQIIRVPIIFMVVNMGIGWALLMISTSLISTIYRVTEAGGSHD